MAPRESMEMLDANPSKIRDLGVRKDSLTRFDGYHSSNPRNVWHRQGYRAPCQAVSMVGLPDGPAAGCRRALLSGEVEGGVALRAGATRARCA